MNLSQVDASTVKAGSLFSDNCFIIPDYQRKYSWGVDNQVADFWRDLSGALNKRDYFLGLVILSQTSTNHREVVDGQQRLITLSLLVNCLRLKAVRYDRHLVAESLRTDFLYTMDYDTEAQTPRLILTDLNESDAYNRLLELNSDLETVDEDSSSIVLTHKYLMDKLTNELSGVEKPAVHIGRWAEFLSKYLTFAVFLHPDRSAAFRVYEVVNTRGKELTPTELIKSYLIGESGDHRRQETYERWRSIEEQILGVSNPAQLTTFVRHVVTLEAGYVIPRDLYQQVAESFEGSAGVDRLLELLEKCLPSYLEMLEPDGDVSQSDSHRRYFRLADVLAGTRFRPIMLCAALEDASEELLSRLFEILVPGLIYGRFASGSIEAQFARAARRIWNGSTSWQTEFTKLATNLPNAEEFELRFNRGFNRNQALVILSALSQNNRTPELVGFAHQVRTRNAQEWPHFNGEDFKDKGTLIGNWVLTSYERRPQGSQSPDAVNEKILSGDLLSGSDRTLPSANDWSADFVSKESARLGKRAVGLWF